MLDAGFAVSVRLAARAAPLTVVLKPATLLVPASVGCLAFKLIEAAQHRWRAVNAPYLVALVRAGARFERGKLVERPAPTPAAA